MKINSVLPSMKSNLNRLQENVFEKVCEIKTGGKIVESRFWAAKSSLMAEARNSANVPRKRRVYA